MHRIKKKNELTKFIVQIVLHANAEQVILSLKDEQKDSECRSTHLIIIKAVS